MNDDQMDSAVWALVAAYNVVNRQTRDHTKTIEALLLAVFEDGLTTREEQAAMAAFLEQKLNQYRGESRLGLAGSYNSQFTTGSPTARNGIFEVNSAFSPRRRNSSITAPNTPSPIRGMANFGNPIRFPDIGQTSASKPSIGSSIKAGNNFLEPRKAIKTEQKPFQASRGGPVDGYNTTPSTPSRSNRSFNPGTPSSSRGFAMPTTPASSSPAKRLFAETQDTSPSERYAASPSASVSNVAGIVDEMTLKMRSDIEEFNKHNSIDKSEQTKRARRG